MLLLVVGTLIAIAHGCALPLMTIVFGDVTNAFINQAATQSYVNANNTEQVLCASSAVANISNMSFPDSMAAVLENIATGTADCNASAFGVTLEEILLVCFSNSSQCLENDDFFTAVDGEVYRFVGIAVGVFIAGFIQVAFFQAACERQVKKIRLLYYRSILKQDISWFDANPSGELSSRLTE